MTVDLRSVKRLYTSSGVPLKALYHVQSGKKLWSASDGMTVRGTLKAGTSRFTLGVSAIGNPFPNTPASIAVNGEIVSKNSNSAYFLSVAEGANIEIKFGSLLTSMKYMFSDCSSLTSLDLSSFDTSKVTDVSWAFSDCSSLTSLDLSSFDTSKVTDVSWAFSDCSSLTSLDLSSFDTSKVANMKYMFSDCSSLTSLDLSSFDTSKVTNTIDMFWRINPNCITKVGKGWTSNMPTPPNKIVV